MRFIALGYREELAERISHFIINVNVALFFFLVRSPNQIENVSAGFFFSHMHHTVMGIWFLMHCANSITSNAIKCWKTLPNCICVLFVGWISLIFRKQSIHWILHNFFCLSIFLWHRMDMFICECEFSMFSSVFLLMIIRRSSESSNLAIENDRSSWLLKIDIDRNSFLLYFFPMIQARISSSFFQHIFCLHRSWIRWYFPVHRRESRNLSISFLLSWYLNVRRFKALTALQ